MHNLIQSVVFLCLLPVFSFGQKLQSFDVTFSPELTYRVLYSKNKIAKTLRNQEELPGLGYRFGVQYNQFSRDSRRSFRTGLTYSTSGYRKEGENIGQKTAWNAFELPVAMRFYAGERACASFVDVGVGLHYRMGETILRQERTLFSANLGFGFAWAFNKSYGIVGQLPLRYSLTPFDRSDVKEHLISTGFEIGVRRYLFR